MEKQAVAVDICNVQIIDGEEERIEMRVFGTLQKTQEGFLLEYTEYDENAHSFQTTVRVVGDTAVYVTRKGVFSSEMQFEVGKRNSTVYMTPYGEMLLGVYTKSVENALGADGGCLQFCYTTDFNTHAVIENAMTLTVSRNSDTAV